MVLLEWGVTVATIDVIMLHVIRDIEVFAHFETINTPPSIKKLNGPNGRIEKETCGFVWIGSDMDGFVESYEYRLDGGGWVNAGVNTSYTWIDYAKGAHTSLKLELKIITEPILP